MFLKKKMPGAVLDCLILCSSLQGSRELLSLIYSQSEQLPEINVTSFRGTVWKFSDLRISSSNTSNKVQRFELQNNVRNIRRGQVLNDVIGWFLGFLQKFFILWMVLKNIKFRDFSRKFVTTIFFEIIFC